MNKKLLTAAVGAALAMGPMLAAQADVKVYGHIQVEVASEEVTDLPGGYGDGLIVRTRSWDGFGDSIMTVEDNQRGRFGIKAEEDLGGGLKGHAMVEYDIGDTPTFGTGPTIREANVGLTGAFGTFLAGSMKTPYKYIGGVKYDPFVTTNLEARRNGGMTGGNFGHNGFADNALGYITPKMLPVKVWAVYSPDENVSEAAASTGANATWGDGDYSIGASFGMQNWEVFAVTNKNKHNPVAGSASDYTATKIGGKVTLGPHTIVAQYEDTKSDAGTSAGCSAPCFFTVDAEGQVLFVGYHFKMGNTTLVAQGADGELDLDPFETQEWTYWTLGAIHNFSKTTRVFAGYTKTDVKDYVGASGLDGDRTAISVGIRKDF